MVGNVLLKNTYNINNETEICAKIPWSHIVTAMFTRQQRDGYAGIFDANYPVNNPPKFQVSLFYDTAGDGDDLFTFPGLNIDVNDWLPDTARVANATFNPELPCGYNYIGGYGDVSVLAEDVAGFLLEFGKRTAFSKPCPTCEK
jgi:hypothetical protein